MVGNAAGHWADFGIDATWEPYPCIEGRYISQDSNLVAIDLFKDSVVCKSETNFHRSIVLCVQ